MNQYEFVVVFFSSLSFTINNTIYTLIFDRLRICTIWFHCFFFFAWEKHSNSNSTTTITYMFFRFFFVWDGCQMVTLWFSILFLRNLPDRKFIDLMWVKRIFYIYWLWHFVCVHSWLIRSPYFFLSNSYSSFHFLFELI